MRVDLMNKLDMKTAFAPKAAIADNTAQVSTIYDTQGKYGVCLAMVTGTNADADATTTVLLEHGDAANLSDAAAVPDEQLNGTELLAAFTFADDDETRKLGYIGVKRYIRATVTPANNTGTIFLGGIWLGLLENAPGANPPM